MTGSPHGGSGKMDEMTISVIVYSVAFVILLILSIIFGGPITAGFCVLGCVILAHLSFRAFVNRKAHEH